MGIATSEKLGQAVPLEDLRGFIREFGAEAVFVSVSQEARAKQILEALPEFEAAGGVRVFVGDLAFESEKLRRAAGKRFLSVDVREAADAGSNCSNGRTQRGDRVRS